VKEPAATDADARADAEAFARAQAVMPGGVSSPVRAFGAVGGTPRFAARGEGTYLIDLDGRRYIDVVGSWGPLILGHAHPKVVEAIVRAAAYGTTFGAPTAGETELAERIVGCVPSIEQVRFTSSGTEAAMSALRLARAATGRSVIVKFAGCYHGHADPLLVSAGSGVLTHALPDSAGVTEGAVHDTRVVAFNDPAALEAALAPGDVAAVILEPVPANMGVVPPTPGFLEAVRASTTKHGALLLFDEVITGFRLGLGGAQERFGITPDLTVLGKIVGGGMPLAAYGGSRALMGFVAPSGPMYQAGTLAGNPVCVAAGIATIETLQREAPYAALEQLGARLQAGLDAAAAQHGTSITTQRCASMPTPFFIEAPVTDLDAAKRSDTTRFAAWFHAMLDAGVWWPPSQFEAAFVNAAMAEDDVDRVVDAAATAFAAVADTP